MDRHKHIRVGNEYGVIVISTIDENTLIGVITESRFVKLTKRELTKEELNEIETVIKSVKSEQLTVKSEK